MGAEKLSSLSFHLLSSLLERQRLRKLGRKTPQSQNAAQLNKIKRDMDALSEGILALESDALVASLPGEAMQLQDSARELRSQWQRAQKMLSEEDVEISDMPPPRVRELETSDEVKATATGGPSSTFETPYRDDPPRVPSPPPFDSNEEMQTQRHMMNEQDTRLETLSGSIRRQRELSENIGDELDVHTGLLEDLESGLDNTALRLGGARRRLETVGRGARDNWSTLTIAVLIVILLLLIVLFKT